MPIDVPHAGTGRTIADGLVDPDTTFEHVELRHALRPVLAGLAERERQALLLRFVENKTQSEIAEVLGISQVHVSRLLARTLAELRRQLPDLRRRVATGRRRYSTRSSACREDGSSNSTSTAIATSRIGTPTSGRPAWMPSE